MSRWSRLLRALFLGLVLGGCQHQTTIRTEPAGARVWVNLVPLGKSPAQWEERSGFAGTVRLRVAAPGYRTLRDVPIKKRYRADLSLLWLVPGVFPYFFTARLDDELTIKLEKEN